MIEFHILDGIMIGKRQRCALKINIVCFEFNNHYIEKIIIVQGQLSQIEDVTTKSQTLHICQQFCTVTSHSIEQNPNTRQTFFYLMVVADPTHDWEATLV